MAVAEWSDIVGKQATLLQTRKRDGTRVKTPVTAVQDGDSALFLTASTTAKVKRMRNYPDVLVGACTFRGDPTGPTYTATAERLQGSAGADALATIRRAHPIMFGVVIRVRYALTRTQAAVYRLHGPHDEVSLPGA